MPYKRKRLALKPVELELDDIEDVLVQLRDELQASDDQQLVVKSILWLLTSFGLTHKRLKVDAENLPSFSAARWDSVCNSFHLNNSLGQEQLDRFTVSDLILPPSLHKSLLKSAIKCLDVYREPIKHEQEAVHVRVLEAWHVPICQLFQGRIIDKPELRLEGTAYTSGGEIEHELYALDLGILFFVIELKSVLLNAGFNVALAQTLLELHAAMAYNSDQDFLPVRPVYALLTDLQHFLFLKYDGDKFYAQDPILVDGFSRKKFLSGMMKVSERLFSVLLTGFIEYLEGIRDKSQRRAIEGDTSTVPSSKKVPKMKATNASASIPFVRPRKSLENWQAALNDALQARAVLTRKSGPCSRNEAEAQGQHGLMLLSSSVRALSKIGSIDDWDEGTLEEQIDALLAGHAWGN